MAERRVDLYCEDLGHELFCRALIRRLATEEKIRLHVRTRCGRGGHGRAISELKVWQRAMGRQRVSDSRPDLLVLMIDGNCQGWASAQGELRAAVDVVLFPRVVIGCPEPHVERWCIADPASFHEVVGVAPLPDPGKCDRGVYKDLLRRSIERGGQPILTNEMELAPDLVRVMDLYRAGKNKHQRSLKRFVEDLRTGIRGLR